MTQFRSNGSAPAAVEPHVHLEPADKKGIVSFG